MRLTQALISGTSNMFTWSPTLSVTQVRVFFFVSCVFFFFIARRIVTDSTLTSLVALTVYLVLNYVFPATESHVDAPIHDLLNPEEDYGAAYGIYQTPLKNNEKDVEADAEVKSALI